MFIFHNDYLSNIPQVSIIMVYRLIKSCGMLVEHEKLWLVIYEFFNYSTNIPSSLSASKP